MKIAIVECTTECTDAHVRQAKFIQEYLNSKEHDCIILYKDTINNYINEKYDIIIKSYTSYHENYKAEIKLCINCKDNAKFYFITNEYTIQSSGVLNKTSQNSCDWNIIANFDINKITGTIWKNKYFVNLNALFYQPKEKQEKKYHICYYGTYRKNRKKYFKKYFTSENFYLSTNIRSIKKFKKDGCEFTPCKKFVWGATKDTLGLFKYTLYIEDEWIHQNFHNLADRFYEALSNDTVVLFDENCIHTLQNSELKNVDYSHFIVKSYGDTLNRNYEEDLKIQKSWIAIIEQEKEKALKEIESIITAC